MSTTATTAAAGTRRKTTASLQIHPTLIHLAGIIAAIATAIAIALILRSHPTTAAPACMDTLALH